MHPGSWPAIQRQVAAPALGALQQIKTAADSARPESAPSFQRVRHFDERLNVTEPRKGFEIARPVSLSRSRTPARIRRWIESPSAQTKTRRKVLQAGR